VVFENSTACVYVETLDAAPHGVAERFNKTRRPLRGETL
jgi:hypothetical protein